ncbi:MAG: NAD(P)H-dependent oxidoreductase [Cyclobacteriaceae bacterium]
MVIVGSHRDESDTLAFTEKILGDIPHKLVNLRKVRISPYCYSGKYREEDQFDYMAGLMAIYNPIVFATPVYWYSMSGIMKDYFDRITDLLTINKPYGRKLRGKTIYVISVGSDRKLPDGFEMPFRNTAKYLGMKYGGITYKSTKINYEEDYFKLNKKLQRSTRMYNRR